MDDDRLGIARPYVTTIRAGHDSAESVRPAPVVEAGLLEPAVESPAEGMHTVIPPGEVIEIPEADYAYGVGVLRLRVITAHVLHDTEGGWVSVIGREVHWSGREGVPRGVMVRLSFVRRWRAANPLVVEFRSGRAPVTGGPTSGAPKSL